MSVGGTSIGTLRCGLCGEPVPSTDDFSVEAAAPPARKALRGRLIASGVHEACARAIYKHLVAHSKRPGWGSPKIFRTGSAGK